MLSKKRDRVFKRVKLTLILFEIVAGLIAGAAAINAFFGLGWGYRWSDALVGFGMMAWGGMIYLACLGIFRFTDDPQRK